MPLDPKDINEIRQVVKRETKDLKQYVRVDGVHKLERPLDLNRQEAIGFRLPNMTSTERSALVDLVDGIVVMETDTGDVYKWSRLGGWEIWVNAHSELTGLTTGDDHTQYFLLAGRSGGQTGIGGTDASDDLVFQSTSNGTRGSVVSNDDFKLIAGKKLILDGA